MCLYQLGVENLGHETSGRKALQAEAQSKGRCEATEEGMGAGHGLGLGGWLGWGDSAQGGLVSNKRPFGSQLNLVLPSLGDAAIRYPL